MLVFGGIVYIQQEDIGWGPKLVPSNTKASCEGWASSSLFLKGQVQL
jgi:hypothetical protein